MAGSTSEQFENSDVLFSGSVAVEVMTSPTPAPPELNVNVAVPVASVVTSIVPMNSSPSPKPDGSHAALAKNSIRSTETSVDVETKPQKLVSGYGPGLGPRQGLTDSSVSFSLRIRSSCGSLKTYIRGRRGGFR